VFVILIPDKLLTVNFTRRFIDGLNITGIVYRMVMHRDLFYRMVMHRDQFKHLFHHGSCILTAALLGDLCSQATFLKVKATVSQESNVHLHLGEIFS